MVIMMMRTLLPVLAISAALSPALVAAQDLDLDSLVDAQETQAADPASQYGPGDDKEFSASTEDDITSLEKGDLYRNNSSLFKVISIASKGEQGGTFTMQRIGGTNDPSPSWARTSGSGPPSIITRESLWDLHLAVPLFPELEPYLRDAFEEAPNDSSLCAVSSAGPAPHLNDGMARA